MAQLFANNTIGPDYAEQLRKEHDGSKWGTTGARYSGAAVAELIKSRPYLQTALDYGCGKGTLAQAFDSLEWAEYDPGIPGKDTVPSGRFDLVTNTDVLEHVEREKLPAVLKELAAKTAKVLFLDIACYPTGKLFGEGPYKGEDLHLVIEKPEWWKAFVLDIIEPELQLAEYNAISKLSKGKYKDRCLMVLERV